MAGWQQLGLPRWMAERIEKYRSKGGQFRKKEDLLHIYDFPPDLYEQLEPYITLKESALSDRFATNKPYPTNEAYSPRDKSAFPERTERYPTERPANAARPVLQPFDINTANTSHLIALRGIGATLAGRIVKFRDALGGFISTEQIRQIKKKLAKFGITGQDLGLSGAFQVA